MSFKAAAFALMALLLVGTIALADGTNNSSCVSNTTPQNMNAGQTSTVSITFQNTGTNNWSDANRYTLVSNQSSIWGINTQSIGMNSSTVAPQGNYTFTFNITAPTQSSNYSAYWQMASGATSFGQPCGTNVTVTNSSNSSAPDIHNLPDVQIRENSDSDTRIIDLFDYASDNEDSDSELSFRITNQSDSGLIYCFLESDRHVSCDAPEQDETGTNTVTIKVRDLDGREDSDSFNVRVFESGSENGNNNAPVLSSLPNVNIRENSGYRSRLIDLHSYARDDDDSDSELDFRIEDQSNTSLIFCTIVDDRYFECESPRADRTGTSTVTIEVEDSDNEIDSDTFTVKVSTNGNGSNGTCDDIRVSTSTLYMGENDKENVDLDIDNDSDQDFQIDNVDVFEGSTHLSVSNIDFDNQIDSSGSSNLSFDLRSTSITSDKEATVSIEIEGKFDDGTRCQFRKIPTYSFRVAIDNDGANNNDNENPVCADISIDAPDVTINEESRATKIATIQNDSERLFTIDNIRTDYSNDDFTVGVVKRRMTVASGSSTDFELNIKADAVSRTRSDDVELQVSGRFSNGQFCSLTRITENFSITVKDGSDSQPSQPTPAPVPNPQPTPTAKIVKVRVAQSPAQASGNEKVVLENNGDDLTNVTITVLNAPSGVTFSTVTKQLFISGERVELEIDTGSYVGQVNATIRLNSTEGTKSLPIQFTAIKAEEPSATTGLVNFATTTGIAIGLLIVVVLAVIGILSILNKR